MLEAGIHEEYALEILHSTLLTRKKAEYATLDAAVISLQTGTLKTLKAGEQQPLSATKSLWSVFFLPVCRRDV